METRSSEPDTAIAASMMPALAARKATISVRQRGRFQVSMTPIQPMEPNPQSLMPSSSSGREATMTATSTARVARASSRIRSGPREVRERASAPTAKTRE